MSKTKTKRKTGRIITYSILITLAVTFVALIVTAGFIKTTVAPKLDKPYSIQLISEGGFGNSAISTIELVSEENQADIDRLHTAYSDMTDFSVLRGIFENEWFRKVNLKTYEDEDKVTQFKKLDSDEINSLTATSSAIDNEAVYLVVFRYFDLTDSGIKKSAIIDKQTIAYDTVFFFVRYTDIEIASFKMYLIDTEAMETDEDYEIYEIIAYGQLSKVYNIIDDIKKS